MYRSLLFLATDKIIDDAGYLYVAFQTLDAFNSVFKKSLPIN